MRRIYENISERNPHIEFLVDSSKELSWIYDRIEDLDKDGVDYEVIAIWKHPLEIALSLMKRGGLNNFGKVWIDYYNNLASIVSDPYAVSYSDLAKDSSICLEQVLNRIGFAYEENSEEYWSTTHHTLFGSAASRIHLHEKMSDEYNRLMRYICYMVLLIYIYSIKL